jgi:hypothetical protein
MLRRATHASPLRTVPLAACFQCFGLSIMSEIDIGDFLNLADIITFIQTDRV